MQIVLSTGLEWAALFQGQHYTLEFDTNCIMRACSCCSRTSVNPHLFFVAALRARSAIADVAKVRFTEDDGPSQV